MSAEDIKFPPSERREVRQFEVPPWEQDQFEQLQEARAAQEAAERAAAERAAAEEAERDVAQETAQAVPGDDATASGADTRQPSAAGEWTVEPAEVEWEGAPPGQKADDAKVDAMLAQLAQQEESATRPVAIVSLVAAALLVAIGCVMIVWAMAGFVVARRAGFVGTFGGTVLLAFGAGFVAGGIWIWMRNLRQRGVL